MQKLVKFTTTSSDALNRFKQCFNDLSGREIDQKTFEKIERFKIFLSELRDLMLRFKQIVEKAMTKKVEADVQKQKVFDALADLEELLTSEYHIDHYKMRAEQRVLDNYRELNNDTHWKVLETIDDFIRDQLTDV